MNNIQQIIEKTTQSRAKDKKYLENIDHDLCMICGSRGNDRRTLRVSMFYDLKEVSDLFKWNDDQNLYYLRMCKGCRSALMTHLGQWINEMGRKKYGNLDESGNLSFSTEADFWRYRDSVTEYKGDK